MGPQLCQAAQRWVQVALDSGYTPDTPVFTLADVAYVTLRRAIRIFFGTGRGKRVCGGEGGGYITGAWAWKPPPGEPLSPIPKLIGAWDFTQAKVFTDPRSALMHGSHWEV